MINKLRTIVSEHQAAKVDGVLVDVVTANMLVTIADKLNPTNREKLLALLLKNMVGVGWQLVGGGR